MLNSTAVLALGGGLIPTPTLKFLMLINVEGVFFYPEPKRVRWKLFIDDAYQVQFFIGVRAKEQTIVKHDWWWTKEKRFDTQQLITYAKVWLSYLF